MFISKLLLNALLITITGLVAVNSAHAQQAAPFTYKSLFWGEEKIGVEIYLSEKRGTKGAFSLTVISEKNIQVYYRTRINSIEDVNIELETVKSKGDIKYYEIDHHFSKMTIWMALEFKLGGKKIESLTRTFSNGLFEIVPNDYFLKELK